MRIKRLAGLLVMMCAIALSGCARIALYTDEHFKSPEVGFKFYYSKPYLLVARTGAKVDQTQVSGAKDGTSQAPGAQANPVQVSVIYLPDQKNVRYAELKTGYGSAELSLAFQNGMLTNIGQKTDTKIPETITALASMATAVKGLVPQAAPYREISERLKSIADGLSTQDKIAQKKALLTNNELQILDSVIKKINDASSLLFDPTKAADNLPTVVSYLKNSIDYLKPMAAAATTVRMNIQSYVSNLEVILQQLSPPPVEKPTFELYEIDNSTGNTVLRRVNVEGL